MEVYEIMGSFDLGYIDCWIEAVTSLEDNGYSVDDVIIKGLNLVLVRRLRSAWSRDLESQGLDSGDMRDICDVSPGEVTHEGRGVYPREGDRSTPLFPG